MQIPPIPPGTFKTCRLLLTKKHRRESGTCIIEGKRFVGDALGRPGVVSMVLLTHRFAATSEGRQCASRADRGGAAVWLITERQLAELSDTVMSQGVLGVVRTPAARVEEMIGPAAGRSVLVALDGVSDPGNIGTIIRTGAWFGAGGILLSERSVELANPKLLRSTMGAVFRVPVVQGVDLEAIIPRLRAEGYAVLGAEAGGAPAGTVLRGGGKKLLVFGNEAHGLSPAVRALADRTFGIPGSGAVESLNVAVAVGIALSTAFEEEGTAG